MQDSTVTQDPKKLGNVGEHFVGGWANQVGIACNRVREDECGWDYLFELPRAHSANAAISLDLLPSELRCFVQVKTLTSSDGRSKIKLSNWHRMVCGADPWFVLVIVLDDLNTPTEAYLVHVNERTCASIQKRLRGLPESEAGNLHKHYSDVSWIEEDRLERLHGLALQAALRFHIGDDLDAYHAQKKAWSRGAGYDENSQKVQVTFDASSAEAAQEMLVDLVVGLRDEVPCSVVEAAEVRFGIEKPLFREEGATISVSGRAPDGETTIVFREGEPPKTVELNCEVFASQPYIDDIEDRLHKTRFVAPLFSAILRRSFSEDGENAGSEPTVSLKFCWNFGPLDWEKEYLIGDLARAANAATMLHRSALHPIGFGFVVDGEPLWCDGFQANGVLDRQALRLWTRLAEVARIAKHFGIPESTAVRVASLMDQELAIQFLSGTLEGTADSASFSVKASLPSSVSPEVPVAALVAVTSVRIGETVVARCLALKGKPEWERISTSEQRLLVSSASVQVMSEWQVPADVQNDFGKSSRVEAARQTLERDGVELIVSDDGSP